MNIVLKKKIKIILRGIYFFLFLFMVGAGNPLLQLQTAHAATIVQNSGGLLVYADGTVGTPKYRTFDDTNGFDTEQSASSVGAQAIEWIRVAASPLRDEWIIATRDAGDVIKAQVCTGIVGGISCGSPTTITATAGTHGFRNFDVAYEMTSGDALLVYGTATADELRKIEWNGTSWTNDAAITTTRTTGTVEWVELTSRNSSNEIGIAYADTNDDVSAYRWSGTAVGNEATAVITATASTANIQKMDVSFEGTSGSMVVAAPVSGAGTTAVGRVTTGGAWTIVANTAPDNVTNFIDLQEPNPSDNDIAMIAHGVTAAGANTAEGYETDGSNLGTNGGLVDGTIAVDATALNWATGYQFASVAYVSSTYYAVGVFSDTTGADDINWWTMNSAGTWTAQADNTRTRGNIGYAKLFDYPAADKVLLLSADANGDLWADTWNGSTPSSSVWVDRTSGGALETALASTTTELYDFAFRRAAFPVTAGTIGTQTASLSKGTTNNYLGGAFTFTTDNFLADLTGVTITENGTIDAQNNLDNIKLLIEADSVAPYDCNSVSYNGNETQFGATDTDGFSAADGTVTFSGSSSFGSTQALCAYVVLDVASGATGGQTIDLSIASTSDWTVSIISTPAVLEIGTPAIAGTTTIPNEVILGDGTDGLNVTTAPGHGAQEVDRFTLATGTGTDTVTGMTVTLGGGANAYQNIATVDVQTTATPGWIAQTNSGSRSWADVAVSTDGTKLAAVVSTGYIYTSTDSGATWTERTGAGSRAWNQIASSADGVRLFASPVSGYIYTSDDGGATWTERTTAGSRNWRGIASSADGTKLAAVVSTGYIYTSTDSGATWTERTGAGSRAWSGIASSADGTKLVAVVYNGYIYTSTDSGATWTERTAAGSTSRVDVSSSPDGTKLLTAYDSGGTFGGYVTRSTDSGANWLGTGAPEKFWSDVASSADGTVLIAAENNGYIYVSTNSGSNWTEQTSAGIANYWRAVASSADGRMLSAVDSTGFVFTYSPSGETSKCSATPSSNTVTLTGCNISVNTTPTEYKVMITPKTHANMPAVPGASYDVTATVTSITATNQMSGTDTDSATITIDNLSPNNATSTSGTAGTGAITLNWTASNSTDISQSVVLRWAASTPGAEVPVEGSIYTAGNTITTATVACVLSSTTSQAHSSVVDGTGGTAGCTTSALTAGQEYSYKVFSKDIYGNYDAGVTFTGSPFTPLSPFELSGTADASLNGKTVRVVVNGALDSNSTVLVVGGSWTFDLWDADPTTGQSVVVFASESDEDIPDNLEAVAVSKYDGSGNMSGMSLVPGTLSIGSANSQSVSLSDIDDYTCSSDEDVMHSVSANVLNLQGCSNSYSDETLSVLGSNTLTVATAETITTEKINNAGTITASGSPTFNIDGTSGTLFTNSGTFTQATSTVNLRGNGNATINSGSPTFYNLISSGTGTKMLGAGITLAADGSLSVTNGTFDPASYLVSSAGISNTSVSNGATLLVNAAAFSDNYEVDVVPQGTRTTLGTAYVARNIATDSEHVFVGENFSPGRLKRIYKNNFTARDVLTFNSGYNGVPSLWQNATDLFVGNYTSPGRTIRVNKSTFTQADQVTFTTGENQIFSLTGDASYVYSGTDTSPGKIMRSAIGNLASYTTKTLNSGDNKILSLINDDTYIYGTLYTSPGGKIFRLNKSDFSTYTTKTFASGEDNAHFITQDDTYLYVGLDTSPAKVARVNKSDFSTTTVLTLPSGYDRALSITNDQDYVYVGLYIASTGRVVKISKSDFATYSTIDLSGSHSTYGVAIDGGYLYTASNGVTQVDRYAVEPIGTTFTFNTGSTVSYAANGAQTIRADLGYANLKIDTAGTKTLGGNTTATGTVTVNAGTLDTDSVNNRSLQAQRITIETGATLLANASAITLTGTSGTLFSNSGTFTQGASTVTLSGNGDATINSGNPIFNHLISSGTGTKTLGANLSVYGNLTVQGGGTFDPSTYTVSMIGGTIYNTDSTIRIGGSAAANSYSGVSGASRTGTTYVEYSRSGDQTVSNSSAYRFGDNLVTSGSGTKTMGGSVSFTSANIGSGTTLAIGGTTLTLSGTGASVLTGSGTLNGGTGTVKFTGDGVVTIPAKGYYHLELSPTITNNRIYTIDATTVTGNFTINPTAASALALTAEMGANLSVTGTTTIQGTTSGTATLDTKPASTNRDLTTGYLSIQSGGTLDATNATSTITLSGTSGTLFTLNSGTFNPGSSTVTLSGNGTATINSGTPTFYNLSLTGTGTKIASSALTIDGSLNVNNASAVFNTAGNDLTVAGAVTNSGTFSTGTVWEYSRPITIDYTKVANTNQTNFPVLISGTYDGTGGEPDLRSTGNGGKIRHASGYDIAFYADAALTTPLSFEQETWNGTTGAINYWVKIPSLSASTNTTIYMAYGNASVDSFQGDSQGTWDSNFKGVWHFPDGSTLSVDDSTSNTNNPVNTGVTAVSGQFGGGAGIIDTSDKLTIADIPLSGVDYTISTWFKIPLATDGSAWNTLTRGINNDHQIIVQRSDGHLGMYDNATSTNFNTSGYDMDGLSNGWHHLVARTSGTTTLFYIDGAYVGTANKKSNAEITTLGNYQLSTQPWGEIDELRISTGVSRSADWIATEYNNQSSPSTFYSIGSETTLGGADSVVTLSGTGTVWNNSGTFSGENSTIKLTNTSATEKTFAGGGATYNNLWLAGGAGGGDYVITGNNTFNDFKSDGSVAHTVSFAAGSTQTLRTFTIAGTAGNEVTLTSTTTSPFTLVKSGAGDIESDYLAIQYSSVTPYGEWTAGTHSTDMGSNSGWIFNTRRGSRGGGSVGNAGGESAGGGAGNTGGEGTCSDGQQNGNETGIDTGGRCSTGGGGGGAGGEGQGGGGGSTGGEGTCSDGQQNGNETGIDTGGRCSTGGGGGDVGYNTSSKHLAYAAEGGTRGVGFLARLFQKLFWFL